MNYSVRCVFVGMSLVVLSGCASGSKLNDFPQRVIDRPYTVPLGVKRWSTTVDYSPNAIPVAIVVNPLAWEIPLSDTLSLQILPLLLKKQISSDPSGYWGISGGLSAFAGTYSSGGPSLTAFWWKTDLSRFQRIGSDFSVASGVGADFVTQIGTLPWSAGAANVFASLGYQINDKVYIQGGGSFLFGSSTAFRTSFYTGINNSVWVVPVFVSAKLQLSRQWEAGGSYTYAITPFTGTHTLGVGFNHYW